MTVDHLQSLKGPILFCRAAVSDDKGRILLVRDAQGPYAAHWDLPGGVVRHMEPLEVAIVRTLHDSLGILVWPHRVLSVAEQFDVADGSHIVSVVYAAKMLSRIPRERPAESMRVEGWYSPQALPQPIAQAAQTALGKGHFELI
ncbi:hypothetical protein A9K65_008445 [Mesorhizobium sp. WSM1497]|uniref:NUDIX domain-containing protein n=1 Tax=Mesorhizobium sp. WSM1497 TaxID=278153 RepID=UPI0007ECB5FC|nr:NUDIX domain-containing protein [Mesorhizobium sp. WSM1497]ARP63401.1 hypothetical protein A9K65_008445 [Mesorhizobium sp. WSM1497]